MDERAARAVADALGGESWQSGGGIWLVLLEQPDWRLVVISSEAICEYADRDAFEAGQPCSSIVLA
jgi:hypothetical protein